MQIYNNRNEKPFWELRETGCEQNDRIFCIYPKKTLVFRMEKRGKLLFLLWFCENENVVLRLCHDYRVNMEKIDLFAFS